MSDTSFPPEFPNGHFYSPYPSQVDAKKQAVGCGNPIPRQLTGIDTNTAEQFELWQKYSDLAGDSYLNCQHRISSARYTYENNMFNRCDAAALHCFLRHYDPKRIIEIGSGFTSCVTLDTREFHQLSLESFTLIEPYPERLKLRLKPLDYDFCQIHEKTVQEIDPCLFESLENGDLLFIDSTHVCKSGSDVLFEFCEILPKLAKGVFIHFHDIFWPFEYPIKWYETGRAWNETYLLRALLANNTNYQIKIHPHYLMAVKTAAFADSNWKFSTSGGSIYLQKLSHPA